MQNKHETVQHLGALTVKDIRYLAAEENVER
jgi:hypothetical protein